VTGGSGVQEVVAIAYSAAVRGRDDAKEGRDGRTTEVDKR
jgi:hypothetical protein